MNFSIKASPLALSFFAVMMRRGLVIVPGMGLTAAGGVVLGLYGPNTQKAFTYLLDLERYGYQYDAELLRALSWLSQDELDVIHQNVVMTLTDLLGEDLLVSPLYPNFPAQVITADDAELLMNALVHQIGAEYGLVLLPKYAVLQRERIDPEDLPKPRVLRLGTGADVVDMAAELFSANMSLSPTKREALISLLDMLPNQDLATVLAGAVPQRETLALVGGWLLQRRPEFFSLIADRFNTATSVLRLLQAAGTREVWAVTALEGKFASVSRPIRRQVLGLLDALPYAQALDDMVPYREVWVRAGEVLHPGEYSHRYPAAYGLITALRNKQLPKTFGGSLEACLTATPVHVKSLVGLLRQRPGVFARRLLEAWRKVLPEDRTYLVSEFLKVAGDVSTAVLLQLRHRVLQSARGATGTRGFLPKGGAVMWVAPAGSADLPAVEADVLLFELDNVLLKKYADYPALGKVYVSPELSGYTLPFGQRTAQKALHTLARGSRIKLPQDQAILRAFLWWNEQGVDVSGKPYSVGRVDLDLSCLMLDAEFNPIGHCSYWNLRDKGLTHSGDIVTAPNGACEYLDIKLDALGKKVAYLALGVYSYTQQNFADLPEAHVGWMLRKDEMAGKIFDARTVQQKIDLTLAGSQGLIGLVDVANREFIWADLQVRQTLTHNEIVGTRHYLSAVAKVLVSGFRPELLDAVNLRVATSAVVTTPEEADVLFVPEVPPEIRPGVRVVTPYDTELLAEMVL